MFLDDTDRYDNLPFEVRKKLGADYKEVVEKYTLGCEDCIYNDRTTVESPCSECINNLPVRYVNQWIPFDLKPSDQERYTELKNTLRGLLTNSSLEELIRSLDAVLHEDEK